MSPTVPISRRDPQLPAATAEREDDTAMTIITACVGVYLLVMIAAWRLALAVMRLVGAG